MSTVEDLRRIVGAPHVLDRAEDMAPFLVDWRKRYFGQAQAVVLPSSADQVAAVIACLVFYFGWKVFHRAEFKFAEYV